MKRRKTVDTKFIMSLGPCDDWPESRVREAVPKRIPLVEFLRAEHIPPEDRLWVALHEELLSDRLMRLFACDCVERVLQCEREAGREPDERSWNAVAVARRYANGEATPNELAYARLEAWAATDAVYALASARSARDAARTAAWSAGWFAYEAAINSSRISRCAASRTAACWESARWSAEQTWQLNHLIEMIEAEQ